METQSKHITYADAGVDVSELRVDGGPTRNRYLMQMQADIAEASVVVSSLAELSAAGAAFVAGRSAGVWAENEIYNRVTRSTYEPALDAATRAAKVDGWHAAIRQVKAHV